MGKKNKIANSTNEEDLEKIASDLVNVDDTVDNSDDNISTEDPDESTNDGETSEDDIEIPNPDTENVYEKEPEEEPSTVQAKAQEYNTVPALCTYYKDTELMKVLAVSNNQKKLTDFAEVILTNVNKDQEKINNLLESYVDDPDINSFELFSVFAKTYEMKAGLSDDDVSSTVRELIEDGYRVAVTQEKVYKKVENRIYYTKNLYTLDEAKEISKVEVPKLYIENILVL